RADVDVLNNTNFDTPNLFGLWVAADLSDPAHHPALLVQCGLDLCDCAPAHSAALRLQGGLGLPDRDYYLDASPRMAEIRDRYQAHVAAMLGLAGLSDTAPRPAPRVARE